ncbi:hypothetical protein ACOSQ4_027105 [Xanthoceras sorbifolium]
MSMWVRLSKLSLEWMDIRLLWIIGGMLGSMCKVDPITVNQVRGRFARVCVEIYLSKPLAGTLIVDKRLVKVEYESLGAFLMAKNGGECSRYQGRESLRVVVGNSSKHLG